MNNNKSGNDKIDSTKEIFNSVTALMASLVTDNIAGGITSVGSLLFALKARHFNKFKQEYTKLQDKNEIKKDYYETEKIKTGIQELLSVLKNDSLDENIFDGMKKIFLVAATEKFSNRLDYLPLEYMRICRILEPGEILLLLANYNIIKERKWKYSKSVISVSDWSSMIAENSELKYGGLILFHEKCLIDKNLLQDRSLNDRSGVGIDRKTFRLTDLGFALCEYI